MHPILGWLFRYAAVTLLVVALPAQATLFHLDGTYQVSLVRGDDLTGLINPGDEVKVEAFYDTDYAQLVEPFIPGPVSSAAQVYNFPAGRAGIRYTVNDLVWEANGPMSVAVDPRALVQFHEDGSEAATFGGPGWLAYTHPFQNPYLELPGSIQTPFGTESGVGQWMLYLPTFETPLPSGTNLPTDLDVSQLAGPFFIHGSAAGEGPNGDYFFNFTSPVPEPETYAMLMAGLVLLGMRAKHKRPVPQPA